MQFSQAHNPRRIARTVVALLFLGFFQVGIETSYAEVLPAPTIASITSGDSTLTVNMSTAGYSATQWAVVVNRRDTSGSCANPYTDGYVNNFTIGSTINLTGLTNGCAYRVSVAGYLNGIGNWSEKDGIPNGYASVLNYAWINDAGTGANYNRTPISSGTCATGTVATIANTSWDGTSTRPIAGCNLTQTTGYYSGYIKGPITGQVTFKSYADDASSIAIQGNTVAYEAGTSSGSGTFNMVQGQVYRFEAWFHNDGGPGSMRATWSYSGQVEQDIPSGNFANDPSVLAADGGCSLGMASRCPAGSALEIKQATGTNVDGQYWINVSGTPTLVYCIMNSAQGGGGWMLAMRAKSSSSTFVYNSSYWVNNTLTNSSYPERYISGDTLRNADAKYAPFSSIKTNQLMVLFPDYTSYGDGRYSSTNSNPGTGQNYGYSWAETFTTTGSSIAPWTAYNSTTGWGGNSYNVAQTGPTEKSSDPSATPSCIADPNTLTNLFLNANRCAFRRVANTWNSSESPYPVIGNGLFYTQANIGFFGINYASASTGSQRYKTRIGLGWNENGAGDEGSNDGTAGIGLDNANATTQAAGSYIGCCATQSGVTSGTHMAFEIYVRNTQSSSISGQSYVRINSGRSGTGTIAQSYSQAVTSGSATYRVTPLRTGISINPSTGALSVSPGMASGTYYETVTATDGNAASAALPVTISVIADSSETDTALTFNGSSHYLKSSSTYSNTSDFSMEAWVKPADTCSNSDHTIINYGNSWLLCKNGFYVTTFADSTGNTWTYLNLGIPVRADAWIHLAVTRTGSTVRAYVNNQLAQLRYLTNGWVSSYTQSSIYAGAQYIYIGGTGNANAYFNGAIDEVKFFKAARTQAQIWSGANNQESLNNSDLVAYYDFNEGTGSTLYNRAQAALVNSDLSVSGPAWTTIASTSATSIYTTISITRTLITSLGGWKVPSNVSVASVLVVAGGGGGGAQYLTYTGDTGGGGGGGGVYEVGRYVFTPNTVQYIKVGTGGMGGVNGTDRATQHLGWRGESTTVGNLVAGGGGGASYTTNNQQTGGSGTAGGGGGGSSSYWNAYNSGTSGSWTGASGGTGSNFVSGGVTYSGRNGGLGAAYEATYSNYAGAGGGAGGNATPNVSGSNATALPGPGITSSYTGNPVEYGRGGTSAAVSSPGFVANPIAAGNGGDGWRNGNATDFGASGANGVVVIRYLNITKPTFTSPTNTTLDVGQTETFTTNVAADSATAFLTRTFRWESSTTGSGGTFSMIKQGTGAANAAFSWNPPDTSTSGANFVYRVIVTDSDAAGLFIVDTSTSVYATINKAMVLISKSSLSKTVGISKTETFTVSLGTPGYTYSLLPLSTNFWLDTSTVGSPRIKFSDTVTVGTYYETFTVTDSVSASIVLPLTITVSTPPSFSAAGPQVDSGTVLYLDAGNTASYSGTGGTWNDLSGRGLTALFPPNPYPTMNQYSSATAPCAAPVYSNGANGSLLFDGATTCGYVPNVGLLTTYSYEVWFKRTMTDADITAADYTAMIASPYIGGTGRQISISLHWRAGGYLVAGIWTGTSPWIETTQVYVGANAWNCVSVTYNGSVLSLTLNGNTVSKYTASGAIAYTDSYNDKGLLIGKRFDQNGYFFKGSIASVRVYNRVLSDAEIQQNYAVSRGRFEGTLNENVVTKRYASRFVDTYTVTAGSETITATFTTNALSGIKWNSSTSRSLVLSLQDSLSVGTYYDTITAVDVYGSTSRLPISFTITKADTITVTMGAPLTAVYTGFIPAGLPQPTITGLVGSDTATVLTRFDTGTVGSTCATGGTCKIGDTGPGGGKVFYVSDTFINAADGVSNGGIYLEVAPWGWNGTAGTEEAQTWATVTTSVASTSSAIGTGAENTRLVYAALGNSASGFNVILNKTYGGKSDWFVPSQGELQKIYDNLWAKGLDSVTAGRNILSSTQNPSDASQAMNLWSTTGAMSGTSKTAGLYMRPIRAFGGTTASPYEVETYTAQGTNIAFGFGAASNYQAIVYETSTVKITQANQQKLSLNLYGAVAGSPFTLQISGGSGSGDISETVTAGSSAINCTFSSLHVLSNNTPATEQRYCNILLTKAASRNYKVETLTATVYFMVYASGPTNQMGSGSTIALNGATSWNVDTTTPPSILGFKTVGGTWITSAMAGSTILVIVSNVGSDPITVKFWRNQAVNSLTAGNFGTQIAVSIPLGATTGRVSVSTTNGEAVSASSFTVLPFTVG